MKKFLKKNVGLLVVAGITLAFILLVVFTEDKTNYESNKVSADLNTWLKETKEDKYTVTVMGLSYCSACQSYKPVLTEVHDEYDFELYWFELDTMSETDSAKVTEEYEMKNYAGYVPYTLILKNGQFVADATSAITDKTEIINLLKTNGVIK